MGGFALLDRSRYEYSIRIHILVHSLVHTQTRQSIKRAQRGVLGLRCAAADHKVRSDLSKTCTLYSTDATVHALCPRDLLVLRFLAFYWNNVRRILQPGLALLWCCWMHAVIQAQIFRLRRRLFLQRQSGSGPLLLLF